MLQILAPHLIISLFLYMEITIKYTIIQIIITMMIILLAPKKADRDVKIIEIVNGFKKD